MAGYLPNVPGVRVPWHRDGSLVKKVGTTNGASWTPTGSWTTVSSADCAEMNDGDTTGIAFLSVGYDSSHLGTMMAIVFPQPITWVGHNVMININMGNAYIYWSTDTIDGTDGTWTAESMSSDTLMTTERFRNINTVNIPNVKGVRITGTAASTNPITHTLIDLQIYAQWTPMTLAAWHPTLDQQVDGYHLDFGNVLLGEIHTKQFRIKNGRGLTANNVVVSCTSGTAEFISGLTFSLDGTTFTSTVTVPSIAPGGISGTVYVRRTVSAGQSANIHSMAPIDFVATTWT